jgi:glycosyltransferase involved in cell wall biosynthesis
MQLAKPFARPKEALHGLKTAYLSTYPPTECGIATFCQDLSSSLNRTRIISPARILAINPDGVRKQYPPEVVFQLDQHDLSDYYAAADYVNRSDIEILVVQHEFGIYGGEYGAYLVQLLRALEKPAVVVFHTVLTEADERMKQVAREVERLCQAVVVMNSISAYVLTEQYGVPLRKMHFIHHGVPTFNPRLAGRFKRILGLTGRTVISTFGLINPGKGIEYAVDAMPDVVRRHPDVIYLILGQTHPGVRRHQGESYREELARRIERLGMGEHIHFENRYLTREELVAYLTASDIYVTPYLNPQQAVSGALAYAVGAGKPIISTPYLYAMELLRNGRGMIVDFRNSSAISDCLNILLEDSYLRQLMATKCYRLGRKMVWSQVAEEYLTVFMALVQQAAARVPGVAPVRALAQPAEAPAAGLGEKGGV